VHRSDCWTPRRLRNRRCLKDGFILFLGVYYHLHDPFHALAQIRHCCHRNTLVLIHGPLSTQGHPNSALYNFVDPGCEWLPSWGCLQQLLQATYFAVLSRTYLDEVHPAGRKPKLPRIGWRWRLRMCAEALKGARSEIHDLAGVIEPPPPVRNIFVKCLPFSWGVKW
jgi:tRNA (mo5U34)-methyltransferase